MTAWPAYARIGAVFELGAAPEVLRTELDDGAVRQARTRTLRTLTRTIEAEIADERLSDFRAWAADHAHAYFDWVWDPDGATRSARVVGGVGGIRYVQVGRRPGSTRWTAHMTIEGPDSIVVAAPAALPAIADQVFVMGEPVDWTLAAADAAVTTWAIAPGPPAGLAFDAAGRRLHGTPDAVYPRTRFTLSGAGARGVVARSFTIAIGMGGAISLSRASNGQAIFFNFWPPKPIPAAFLASGTAVFNNMNVSISGIIDLHLGGETRADLSDEMEREGVLDLRTASFSARIRGPDHPTSQIRDESEPYRWTADAATTARLIAYARRILRPENDSDIKLYLYRDPL